MKMCVISFSSRADGNCAAIADCVQETLGAEGLTRFDFPDFRCMLAAPAIVSASGARGLPLF